MPRRPRSARGAMFLALLAALPAAADPIDEWFLVSIAGHPVGRAHTVVTEQQGHSIEETETRIVLNRLGTSVEMETRQVSRETAAGELETLSYVLDLSDQATRTEVSVEDGSLRIVTSAGGQDFERIEPLGAPLLGPAGLARKTLSGLRKVGDRLELPVFSGELGAVATVERELLAIEPAGEKTGEPVLVVRESYAGTALTSTSRLDSSGRLIQLETEGPFGLMQVVRTDAATAARAGSGGELSEESYGATLVRTPQRLPAARRAERMVLELRHRNPALGWPELTGPGQAVAVETDSTLRLEIHRRHPVEAARLPVAADAQTAPFLASNAYIQANRPEARRLATSIIGSETDVYRAGLALEHWVADRLTFDLGVVMAPSSEVLQNRRGTCTEYAVALTTLARSVGIPARFVMGFVYVGGIFGGHAWTEILVGNRWIALDGAVPADGPADAARFAFLWTSLDNGIGELNFGPGVQMYGQIDLDVLEYEAAGVDGWKPGEAGYLVDGNTWSTPSLGVSWTVPDGFTFSGLDAVWPDTSLVSVEGPSGEQATLAVHDVPTWHDRSRAITKALAGLVEAGSPTQGSSGFWIAAGERKAAAATVVGDELWTLQVEQGGLPTLTRLLDGLRLGGSPEESSPQPVQPASEAPPTAAGSPLG